MTKTARNTPARNTDAAIEPLADEKGEAERAAERDLAGLAERAPELAQSALAMSVLELARGLDNPKNSLTSKAMAARALREALDRLLELAPDPESNDSVDQLNAKRRQRLSAGAAS